MSQLPHNKPQLVAELGTFTAVDALQWAKSSQFTGRLAFRSEKDRITLHIDGGGIVQAASNHRIEALGRHLVSEDLIDEIDLAAAMVHSRDSQGQIGAAMVDLGVLEPEVLCQALHDHVLNLATLPVGWTEGWVQAEIRTLEDSSGLRPEPVDATFVLMEASRRIDQLNSFGESLASGEAILFSANATLPDDAPARWRPVLATYEPLSTLGAHYERLGGSYFCFVDTVHQLLSSEILGVGATDHESELDLAQTTA